MGTSYTKWGEEFDVEIVSDPDHEPPWENGHAVVKEGWSYALRGWVSFGNGHHFDYHGSLEKAIEEGWSTKESREAGLSPRRQAAAAVKQELERFRAWCNDKWEYVGVIVTHVETGKTESLWGIESDCEEYIAETREELMIEVCPLTFFGRQVYEAAHSGVTEGKTL